MPFILKLESEEKYICYKGDTIDLTEKKSEAKRFRGSAQAKGCAQFMLWGNEGVLGDFNIGDDFQIIEVDPFPSKQRFKK